MPIEEINVQEKNDPETTREILIVLVCSLIFGLFAGVSIMMLFIRSGFFDNV